MKRTIYIINIMALAVLSMVTAMAQEVTYVHDEMKMNQVTVQEIGSGSLTPDWYYELLHRSYQKNAANTNKLSFRSTAGMYLYQQVPFAEKIDTLLEKRAAVEALNVADRTGGATDVAWMAEGDKLTTKLNTYESNINKILTAGGTPDDQKVWKEYADMYKSAIREMQDSYQPNAQRKKQYLEIYADLARRNDLLVKRIALISKSRSARDLLRSPASNRTDRKAAIVADAMNRWRVSGWNTMNK